jgi:hypothetical protein
MKQVIVYIAFFVLTGFAIDTAMHIGRRVRNHLRQKSVEKSLKIHADHMAGR